MQGNNNILINQATMIEALQQYFDKQFVEKLKVTSVKLSSAGAYNTEYEVAFEKEKA